MHPNDNIEERLWDYMDGIASPQEVRAVEELISTNSDWRNKYRELRKLSMFVQHEAELDEPSMRFTQNVMESIAKLHIAPAASTYINKRIIYGLAAFFIFIIGAALAYALANTSWHSTGGGISGISFDMSKIDLSKVFSSTSVNVFIMLNIITGLMLLDRYLGFRKKKLLENTSHPIN